MQRGQVCYRVETWSRVTCLGALKSLYSFQLVIKIKLNVISQLSYIFGRGGDGL